MIDNVERIQADPISTISEEMPTDLTSSKLCLWFLSGPLLPNETSRHIALHSDAFLVGRSSEAALCLASKSVSSLHAELILTEESLTVKDLGSTNGTYVNASRITEPSTLNPGDLVQFADVPFRVLRQNAVSQSATVSNDFVDQALALVQFEQLMKDEAVAPHYQPIVVMQDQTTIGFEVLGRSNVSGLESPAAMFSAASQLSLEVQLSQMLRVKGIEQCLSCDETPHLFVNTHPTELIKPGLIESMEAVRQISPNQQITLEIHESAITSSVDMKRLQIALQSLNVGLAFDDFGAGQARIAELCDVNPDYLKFDMSLIRSIHQAPAEHIHMVSSLVQMARDIGVVTLAEGIECENEARTCREIGFELAQGYYFGRPAPLFPRK